MISSHSPQREINVLLVEDDEVDILNIRRAFRKTGIHHPVYVAQHGKEALCMLRGTQGESPAVPCCRRLVLLDLNMPHMNGIQFLEELRSDPHLQMIPVVVLTTSDADEDLQAAFRLNVAGYILKSSTFTEFAQVMSMIHHYWLLNEMP